jgi:hypothetical protein
MNSSLAFSSYFLSLYSSFNFSSSSLCSAVKSFISFIVFSSRFLKTSLFSTLKDFLFSLIVSLFSLIVLFLFILISFISPDLQVYLPVVSSKHFDQPM